MPCNTCKHQRQSPNGKECSPCLDAFRLHGTEPNWKPKGSSTQPIPPAETLSLPDDDVERGNFPMFDGLLAYFPNALAEVSRVSKIGNDQHNPGQPMHWDRSKSKDHENKILRHLTDVGKKDGRGVRHAARLAWRALALLQEELERDEGFPPCRAARNA